MQKAIIEQVKEVKARREGGKDFYSVKLQDVKKEITTFDSKILQAGSGDTLEFETVLSGDFINLKDGWKLIKQTSSTSSGHNGPTGVYKRDIEAIRAEYDLKAQMQAIERASIEAQTAYNGIIQLAHSILASERREFPDRLSQLYEKALKWAETKLDDKISVPQKAATKTAEKAKVTTSSGQEVDPNAPFPHIGALLKHWADRGIDRSKVIQIIKCKETDLPQVNIVDAHLLLQEWAKQNPEQLKSQSDSLDPEGLFS